jgi:hypothetical protein
VVDDEVRHHVCVAREYRDVVPAAEACVDLGVIAGIEPGVGAVDRLEKWQQVNAAEQAAERPAQQGREVAEAAARQPIDVGDELDLVLHRDRLRERSGVAIMQSFAQRVKRAAESCIARVRGGAWTPTAPRAAATTRSRFGR